MSQVPSRESLLEHITATSLDADYEHVARSRPARVDARSEAPSDAPPNSPPNAPPNAPPDALSDAAPGVGRRWRLLLVLGLFGLLLTTAAVQTARDEPLRERSREALAAQVQQHRADLDRARADVQDLRTAVTRGLRGHEAEVAAADAARLQQQRWGGAAGALPVTGPGVRIVADDNPAAATERQVVLDEDLQRLVNGLWIAGAEAVAVNGQRLTALSAIRAAGQAITVNFRSLRRPYVVEAIGDPDQLPARFVESDGGAWWLNLRSVYHLRFQMRSEDMLTLPGVPSLQLGHAEPIRPAGRDR